MRTLAADGYFTIVNETVDTADGGVSGVVLGDIMEFAPLDTPRGVEKPGASVFRMTLVYAFYVRFMASALIYRRKSENAWNLAYIPSVWATSIPTLSCGRLNRFP